LRNTAEIWYDTAADAEMDANRQNTLNFTYDALGRMLSAGDQFAGYAYAYDRLGRMISSDAAIAGLAPTVTLTNAYDAAGRRTQVAARSAATRISSPTTCLRSTRPHDQHPAVRFHVDADLRDAIPPASEMPDHVSTLPVADKRVDFTYDLASQAVTLTRFADLSGNQLVAATDYLFDEANRKPHAVTDAQFHALREAGAEDAEIVEALGVMEVFAAFNRFLDTLQVDIDF
jgi:YD repeat-containing protein